MALTPEEKSDFLSKTSNYLQDCSMEEKNNHLNKLKEYLDSYDKNFPETKISQLKKDLGGPAIVANNLLFQAGKKIQHQESLSIIHYLLILSLVTFIGFTSLIGFVVYRFSPLVSINEDRIQILGGLVDIDSKLGSFKVGDDYQFNQSSYENVFEGALDLSEELEDLSLQFYRGQIEISTTDALKISWDCKLENEPSETFIKEEKEALQIDLKPYGGVDCTLKVPSKLKLTIVGENGKIDLIEPLNDSYINLKNGLVIITPHPEYKYRFDTQIENGLSDDFFKSLNDPNGIEIKVEIENGSLKQGNGK